MEGDVLGVPNPVRHVVPIASEPKCERGAGLAVQQVKGLHGATFSDGALRNTATVEVEHPDRVGGRLPTADLR